MNEAETEECKGVRKEEGVAQIEFGIKISLTMKSFFMQFRGATVICYYLRAQPERGQERGVRGGGGGGSWEGGGRPGQGSDSAFMAEAEALSCPQHPPDALGWSPWGLPPCSLLETRVQLPDPGRGGEDKAKQLAIGV